jgi:hypothetical protein
MGDGIYQVRPNEQVWFRNGKTEGAVTDMPGDCGCPEPQPVIRAEATPPPKIPEKPEEKPAPPLIAATTPAETAPQPTQPLPAPAKGETHVEIDAPFVFNAVEPPTEPVTLAKVRLTDLPPVMLLTMPVVTPPRPSGPTAAKAAQPPAATAALRADAAPARRGVFGKVRSFFAAMFR